MKHYKQEIRRNIVPTPEEHHTYSSRPRGKYLPVCEISVTVSSFQFPLLIYPIIVKNFPLKSFPNT